MLLRIEKQLNLVSVILDHVKFHNQSYSNTTYGLAKRKLVSNWTEMEMKVIYSKDILWRLRNYRYKWKIRCHNSKSNFHILSCTSNFESIFFEYEGSMKYEVGLNGGGGGGWNGWLATLLLEKQSVKIIKRLWRFVALAVLLVEQAVFSFWYHPRHTYPIWKILNPPLNIGAF